jgi:glutathione S-transferase
MDLRAGDQFKPDYVKLNPNAIIPTLVHDGIPVIESTVINEYVDETFPDPPLKPVSPAARARMRVWTKKPDEGGHAMSGSLGFALSHRYLIKDTSPAAIAAHLEKVPDPQRRERQRLSIELGLQAPMVLEAGRYFHKLVREMDEALRDHPWLAGDTYSLADVALTPYITRLDDMGMAGFWRGTFPRVDDWFDRIVARPSHRKTIRDQGDPKVFELLRENSRAEQDHIARLIVETRPH